MSVHIRKGPFDCWFASPQGGLPISVAAQVDHNLTAREMAFHLRQVAAWFESVANNELPEQTNKSRRRNVKGE